MANTKVVSLQCGTTQHNTTQHNTMNQKTLYNPKRFRRRRTSAVPSLQSKCYFHINKTSERPKTLTLQFKLQQTNFLITANSVQNELLPRFFPNSRPKHSTLRHSAADSHFS
jgi:hypothetical protein